eukprot:TRINITY_DN28185_c0_g1_i1.p1 TRINITY_DN28185_c0_g1~~TRINITY_DN28185_c0_g1_i1.p1  ORF type:complete len:174 (-),score=19.66 TRINITY_DN28185_c0_g1_i1:90-551(-)
MAADAAREAANVVEQVEQGGADVSIIVDAMEDWLSGSDFDSAWRDCYERACRGQGRSDRNIAESVLVKTCEDLHGSLPEGVLDRMIPEPDVEFIRNAIKLVTEDDILKSGLEDLEHFEAAVVVVYTQLAHCAEVLCKQMPATAKIMAAGVKPV